MAIAGMSKLSLAAMEYDRDGILNALQSTCAAEIKTHALTENTNTVELGAEGLREYLSAAEHALDYLLSGVKEYKREQKIKEEAEETPVLTYTQFLAQREEKDRADGIIARINGLEDEKKRLLAEQSAARRTAAQSRPYASLTQPFADLSGTAHTQARVGLMPLSSCEELKKNLTGEELFALTVADVYEGSALVIAVFHKSFEGERLLSGYGFTACPFKEGTGSEIYENALKEGERIAAALKANARAVAEEEQNVKPLKIYCDYLAYEAEKAELSDKLRATQTTFLLEAYVPEDERESVAAAIEGVTEAVYYEFSQPAEDETPPTLYRNNAVVKNFEAITDMYSPPSSREFDPNTVMAFFYSLFLGFIMGDIGYGLIMLVGGGVIYFKTRANESGLTRLAGVFAVGGVFALVWGILFNSLFGIPLGFMKAVLPDAQKDVWSFMGISVPAVLVISLLLGICQLLAGYICKAYQCFRRGQILDGVFEGIVWAIFSAGVGLAIVGLVQESGSPILATVGGITAGVSLAIAVLTAGRKEKFIGKFTKGFGAAYGVINYASDILSYARLYGLMLSGAVIAQIVSAYSVNPAIMGMEGVGFLFSGNVALVILGVVIMVLGHVFNFAIGLLGAYIHDARLQYVEFYGRFFEGEGELFRPLGSTHRFVRLTK